MKNPDCPVLTEHWLTAWTKICSATSLLWTLKWRKYFPETCLTEGILCNDLSSTLSTEDCAWLFLSRTLQKKSNSVKVCTCLGDSDLFQSTADASPLFNGDKVSLWYVLVSLLSLLNVLEIESIWKWGGAKTRSPLLVHTANRFLCKEKQVYLSFWWCQCPFLQLWPTFFWRKSGWLKTRGYQGRLRLDALVNPTCTCAELPKCAQLWRRNLLPTPFKNAVHRC